MIRKRACPLRGEEKLKVTGLKYPDGRRPEEAQE